MSIGRWSIADIGHLCKDEKIYEKKVKGQLIQKVGFLWKNAQITPIGMFIISIFDVHFYVKNTPKMLFFVAFVFFCKLESIGKSQKHLKSTSFSFVICFTDWPAQRQYTWSHDELRFGDSPPVRLKTKWIQCFF